MKKLNFITFSPAHLTCTGYRLCYHTQCCGTGAETGTEMRFGSGSKTGLDSEMHWNAFRFRFQNRIWIRINIQWNGKQK
jgi:hypothetical protein